MGRRSKRASTESGIRSTCFDPAFTPHTSHLPPTPAAEVLAFHSLAIAFLPIRGGAVCRANYASTEPKVFSPAVAESRSMSASSSGEKEGKNAHSR